MSPTETPLVSILCAVKDEEEHLATMLRSLEVQSLDTWELIAVSDDSRDRTTIILESAAKTDPRIRLVGDNAPLGKVAAYNLAYSQSRGDVIVLLAGDDTLPADSLRHRTRTLLPHLDTPTVAYFKLKTLSDDPSSNGATLPRGRHRASHSGGTITLTRHLADMVFPIDHTLTSEDLWLANAAEALAAQVIEDPSVVLNYRIHAGNSNPRNKDFARMTLSMSARHRAWNCLLESHLNLPPSHRDRLSALRALETNRAAGKTLSVLGIRRAPLMDRLAYASMSNRALFAVRRRFFRLFSGWRGR